MAIKQTIIKAKNKVTGAASTVIANTVFGGNKAKKEIKNANRVVADAKTVRAYKGKPDEGNYTDPLFRARVNNTQDKLDAVEKAKKLNTAKKVMAKPSDYATDYAKMRGGSSKGF